jgi:hypothetical protein
MHEKQSCFPNDLVQPLDHGKWNLMQEHGIGQDFAMYYIAYAAFSELRGNFTRAESIYQQGLER